MSSSFARGVFTLSLDFELVWGSRDLYTDLAPLLRAARITREAVFPGLLRIMTDLGVVATWATVGHLFLGEGAAAGEPTNPARYADLVPPQHAWRTAPWFAGVPAGTEAEHPEFYARSLVLQLRDAAQEIGSHSFSHPIFGDPGCSRATAESELVRCVAEAKALGIELRSFVFPRNSHGHPDLLARHGFTSWRGREPVWYNRARVPTPVRRLAHLGDVAIAGAPPTVFPVRDAHGMWNIPGSGSFLPYDGPRRFIPIGQRVKRAIRGIDRAVEDGRVSHLWLHPINLADEPAGLLAGLGSVLSHAARLREAGKLDILPMAGVAALAATNLSGAAPSGSS